MVREEKADAEVKLAAKRGLEALKTRLAEEEAKKKQEKK